jgi:hypothetical protein
MLEGYMNHKTRGRTSDRVAAARQRAADQGNRAKIHTFDKVAASRERAARQAARSGHPKVAARLRAEAERWRRRAWINSR